MKPKINLQLLVYNTLTMLCEESRITFVISSVIKNIVIFLYCCIAFESASSACCSIRLITISL